MQHSLKFDAFDNPMHLSKVGNWVITFLSARDATLTELAITSVIPRQQVDQLQPRRLHVIETSQEGVWKILALDCYDPNSQTDLPMMLDDPQATVVYQQLISEFAKYDVHVELIQYSA